MKRWILVGLLLIIPQIIQAGEAPSPTAPTDAIKTEAPVPSENPAGEVPLGQPMGTERVSNDIFEKKGGNIHPFLAITEYWTDNAFDTHSNQKSDFTTVISPGIYLALPGMKERIRPIETLNITPGGSTLTRFGVQYPRVFQTYLYYRADIEHYLDSHELNYTSHTVEGVAQYNMRGGLSFEVDDQFVKSRTQRGTGFSFELDKFYGNLFSATAKYEIGDKTLVRVDYSNYYLHFIAPENRFRDRDDNTVSAYLFYKLWPKTALFVEYDYVDITYNQDVVSGSSEQHFFAGLKWDITDKTKGSIKAGYGIKDFNNSTVGSHSHNDLYVEIQLDHKFSPKTTLLVRGSRKTEETDVAQGNFIVADTIGTTLLHRFTTKVTGSLDLSYTNEKYNGVVTFGDETKALNDQYLRAGIAAQYEFKDWLKFDLGYVFSDRISNISALSYINNTIYLRASAIY
ncbi:MAG TPA: outer membrane beta-barrel protein [Dissulfurispiraceae bacterium]|nr:outer membrane beta-barrel protein [Dissulfurispiraceae bacterium]